MLSPSFPPAICNTTRIVPSLPVKVWVSASAAIASSFPRENVFRARRDGGGREKRFLEENWKRPGCGRPEHRGAQKLSPRLQRRFHKFVRPVGIARCSSSNAQVHASFHRLCLLCALRDIAQKRSFLCPADELEKVARSKDRQAPPAFLGVQPE